jgi:LysR family glycine cleavage system transcriptional activator
LREFAERHRTIHLQVETTEVGATPPTSCDAWILPLPAAPSSMIAAPLLKLRLAAACSPELARQRPLEEPRALLDTTMIVHNRRPRAWHDWFARMGVPCPDIPRAIQFDSLFAVARAAQSGLGVALLPVGLSSSWFATGALVQPCAGELETSDRYYLVHRPEAGRNPDVAALSAWITARFAQ